MPFSLPEQAVQREGAGGGSSFCAFSEKRPYVVADRVVRRSSVDHLARVAYCLLLHPLVSRDEFSIDSITPQSLVDRICIRQSAWRR